MNKEKKDMLVFGYGLGVIATVFAVGGIIKHGFALPSKVLLICALVFVTVTTFRWEALRPGYKGWMKVAHLIGMVITTGILSAIFFVLFAPIGLFFRLIRKDHLDRTMEPSASSYWIKREVVAFDKTRCEQQF